jgi:hypothetical protein
MATVSYTQALVLASEGGAIERLAGKGIMSKAAFMADGIAGFELDHETMVDCYLAYRAGYTKAAKRSNELITLGLEGGL